jgi:hypothetical protein
MLNRDASMSPRLSSRSRASWTLFRYRCEALGSEAFGSGLAFYLVQDNQGIGIRQKARPDPKAGRTVNFYEAGKQSINGRNRDN